ncbi:putative Homeodomain-like protein [Seiridium cardinale]|uniref:Homeodomain-like protein n=1 Tax=Seiridium cardinale TaxID=138064 RepID=A0ABR2XJ97_9PEZI
MAADQRRGPWSQHEDGLLMKLVEEQGALNWVKISQLLNTRTPKQCRERYHQNLKPSLNHEPISPEEGEMIEQLVTQIGKRWAEIARRLHNRSDNAVKNWWNGSMNRRKRVARKRQPYDDANDPFGYSGAPSRLRLPTLSTVPYSQQYNLPSPTNSTGQYPQLPWVAGSGLPSPNTAISPTVDSVADGAPSLVSDAGSYYSESPTGYGPESPSHNSLPPLSSEAASATTATTVAVHSGRLGWALATPNRPELADITLRTEDLSRYASEPYELGVDTTSGPEDETG